MAEAADLNTGAPMPSGADFRLKMEGLATALLYMASFGWIHLGVGGGVVSAKVLAVFFAGLIVVPLFAGLPLVFLRRRVGAEVQKQSSISAFLPFAQLALYALTGLVIWVATREAYSQILVAPPPVSP